MSNILVYIQHPETGRRQRATVDSALTAEEVIDDLVREGFIGWSRNGYQLAVEGGTDLAASASLLSAGVKGNDVIQVLPVTEAGGLPGLKLDHDDELTIEKLHQSQHTLNLIVRLYEQLEARYSLLSEELELERFRSQSRFTAALVLLVSQVVLAIGANLLTQNRQIGIAVLLAGGLQACLALFLTFRKPSERKRRSSPDHED